MQTTPSRSEVLGRGRSAIVFLDTDKLGQRIARKVFLGEARSRFVLCVLTGAPNPYGWCEPAVRAAICRRQILRLLVRYWFDGRLTVPRTIGFRWNGEKLVYELSTQFVDGMHVPLCCSERVGQDPLDDLVCQIMKPLQRHLIEAGFDGLVWQAGLGNPVAASNFLLRQSADVTRWAWIDLESGVPALFPINPLALFRFYLPCCFRHGRPLFDDVDMLQFGRYLKQQRHGLKRALGSDGMAELETRARELERHQREWKSLSRTARSLAYFRASGRITVETAQWYADRPWRWQGRLLAHGVFWGVRELIGRTVQLWRWTCAIDWRGVASRLGRFIVSQRYREHLARRYVAGRLGEWTKRKFISPAYARSLRFEMRCNESAACVADFGMHLALKPGAKTITWLVLPLLYLAGVVSEPAILAAVVGCGALLRTSYTALRIAQAPIHGGRPPWIALIVGLLPVLGNVAFPVQLCYSAVRQRQRLAQFLLYDTFARLGRSLPIWGGAGSLLESWFNRIPNILARWRVRRLAGIAGRVHSHHIFSRLLIRQRRGVPHGKPRALSRKGERPPDSIRRLQDASD